VDGGGVSETRGPGAELGASTPREGGQPLEGGQPGEGGRPPEGGLPAEGGQPGDGSQGVPARGRGADLGSGTPVEGGHPAEGGPVGDNGQPARGRSNQPEPGATTIVERGSGPPDAGGTTVIERGGGPPDPGGTTVIERGRLDTGTPASPAEKVELRSAYEQQQREAEVSGHRKLLDEARKAGVDVDRLAHGNELDLSKPLEGQAKALEATAKEALNEYARVKGEVNANDPDVQLLRKAAIQEQAAAKNPLERQTDSYQETQRQVRERMSDPAFQKKMESVVEVRENEGVSMQQVLDGDEQGLVRRMAGQTEGASEPASPSGSRGSVDLSEGRADWRALAPNDGSNLPADRIRTAADRVNDPTSTSVEQGRRTTTTITTDDGATVTTQSSSRTDGSTRTVETTRGADGALQSQVEETTTSSGSKITKETTYSADGESVQKVKIRTAAGKEFETTSVSNRAGSNEIFYDSEVRGANPNELTPTLQGLNECGPSSIADALTAKGINLTKQQVIDLIHQALFQDPWNPSAPDLFKPSEGMNYSQAERALRGISDVMDLDLQVDRAQFQTPDQLRAMLNQGKQVLVSVETAGGGNHWVRITDISPNGEVVTVSNTDPALEGTALRQKGQGELIDVNFRTLYQQSFGHGQAYGGRALRGLHDPNVPVITIQ
jgi:hypothetical protein